MRKSLIPLTIASLSLALAGAGEVVTPTAAASVTQSGSRPGDQSEVRGLLSQSPIDIRISDITPGMDLPKIELRYSQHATVQVEYKRKDMDDPRGCLLRDKEETEEVEIEPGDGAAVVGGVSYQLLQFHFHTPSEHQVQGRHAPMEMHLVHRSDDGRLLVLGVLLLPGATGQADRVLADLPDECEDGTELTDVDLRQLVPHDLATVRYAGSLTTAPFTEGVQWFLTAPQTLSSQGIRNFQKVFPEDNARDVQPLNDRRLVADLPAHRSNTHATGSAEASRG